MSAVPPATPEASGPREIPLVLASASPRRRELLGQAGFAFTVAAADVPEIVQGGESPKEHVKRLARDKARVIAERFPGALVLGADTVVVLGPRILGKPVSPEQARAMLALLSGRAHDVFTGVCLLRVDPEFEEVWICRTRVFFRTLTPEVITRYCALVDTFDKAGAYAVQEHGDMLVHRVEGLRSNVIGLPVEEVAERLRWLDVHPAGE